MKLQLTLTLFFQAFTILTVYSQELGEQTTNFSNYEVNQQSQISDQQIKQVSSVITLQPHTSNLETTMFVQNILASTPKLLEEENEKEVPQSPRIVQRQTILGVECDIPFTFRNKTHYDCFWGHDAMEYCQVNGIIYRCEPLKYPKPGQRSFQEEPQLSPKVVDFKERFTVDGLKCDIPKKYNARYLTDCLQLSAQQEICYAEGRWRYCASLGMDGAPVYSDEDDAKSRLKGVVYSDEEHNDKSLTMTVQRYTLNGKLCVVPFMYNGEQQYDCVVMPDQKEWCFLQGEWEECADLGQFISPSFRQIGPRESNQASTQSTNKKGGQEETAIILAVVFVVLGVIICASIYYFVRFRRNKKHNKDKFGPINLFEMGSQRKK